MYQCGKNQEHKDQKSCIYNKSQWKLYWLSTFIIYTVSYKIDNEEDNVAIQELINTVQWPYTAILIWQKHNTTLISVIITLVFIPRHVIRHHSATVKSSWVIPFHPIIPENVSFARSIFGTMWSKRPEKQLNVNKECDQSVDKSH